MQTCWVMAVQFVQPGDPELSAGPTQHKILTEPTFLKPILAVKYVFKVMNPLKGRSSLELVRWLSG